ncbi:hypothetical protein N7495_003564 [Penicillium taxi]|uniref:uncharacterized protein n=1 Tax=Penicillium taxi TaxID=168475 RepID=UPI002544D390|nr:uncharacterized protein N7495_003564 [Penicillium taxi]KAJ5898820.1 hypothetical protein N7495_003564 [Penicillium taxi]
MSMSTDIDQSVQSRRTDQDPRPTYQTDPQRLNHGTNGWTTESLSSRTDPNTIDVNHAKPLSIQNQQSRIRRVSLRGEVFKKTRSHEVPVIYIYEEKLMLAKVSRTDLDSPTDYDSVTDIFGQFRNINADLDSEEDELDREDHDND